MSNIYSEGLNQLVAAAAAATGLPATRDPAKVAGHVASKSKGCVFVRMPTHVDRLMGGPNIEVPVALVTAAPADLAAADWLLEHLDPLLGLVGARSVTNGPVDIGSDTYPAITATAQIALTTTGA